MDSNKNNIENGCNNINNLSDTNCPELPRDAKAKAYARTNPTTLGTSALLRLGYDGGRFTGWSSGPFESTNANPNRGEGGRRRRRSGSINLTAQQSPPTGFVRPVQGVLQLNLAKLYGNVDPDRVVVEGCSRTDKGVHARELMAQVYCLTQEAFDTLRLLDSSSIGHGTSQDYGTSDDKTMSKTSMNYPSAATTTMDTLSEHDKLYCSIPGKRIPHPISYTDTSYFEPLPMDGNLSRMAFALNRMLPKDVRVTGIAPTPTLEPFQMTTQVAASVVATTKASNKGTSLNAIDSSSLPQMCNEDLKQTMTSILIDDSLSLPFHPSLNAISKTYQYKISVGAIKDPTSWRLVWHIPDSTSTTKSNRTNDFLDLDAMNTACQLLLGRHNFAAFQGSSRGSSDKERRQRLQEEQQANATICTLSQVSIELLSTTSSLPIPFKGLDPPLQTYAISITGDRFLYKMVRFLVGALVGIGTRKLDLIDLKHALLTGSWNVPSSTDDSSTISTTFANGTKAVTSRKEFLCAPANGLLLSHVDYGTLSIDWQPLHHS